VPPRRRKRLDASAFALPIDELRAGRFTDPTARLARDVLLADRCAPIVTMQFVAESAGVLCGVDEALAMLRGALDDWGAITAHALYDGDRIDAGEAVLTIEGELPRFAHLAPLCLGVLSRRTRIATNARALSEAARPKPVMMLPARGDHWVVQQGDVMAAQLGGMRLLDGLTPPGVRGMSPLLLVPHALVAAYGGDTVAAVRACDAHSGADLRLVVPVEYDNDAVSTSLAVARTQEARIWGVQLATSERLVDRSIIPQMGAFVPTGVNAPLVWNVRNALDAEGFGAVRILVSGTFTIERIRAFEEEGVPADAYGVGTALTAGRFGFAADVVMRDGQPQTRVGGDARPTARLDRVR
jgi:nicotinate phosphoribosyltransferase